MIRFISFHFGDWVLATHNMTNQQQGIYLSLMTLYFDNAGQNNGKLDAKDFDCLCWQVKCKTESEINDLQLLLKTKFKKAGNTYRHAEWDKQIKAIMWEIKKGGNAGNAGNVNGNANNAESNAGGNAKVTSSNEQGNANPLSSAERQARYKERKRMTESLINKGIELSDKDSYDEIVTLYELHFSQSNDDKDNENNAESNAGGNEGNAEKPSNNHKPLNHKPLSKNISPLTPQGEGGKILNVAFDDFWDLYDKKVGLQACQKKWARLTNQDRTDIMAYIPRYKESKPDKQFRKDPATFLNNRSWEDEIISEQPRQPQTYDQYGNLLGASNARQPNHQPHPNSTTAYVNRLQQETLELKRELYPERYR